MKRGLALSLALALALSLLTSCEMFVPSPTERPPIGPSGEPSPTGSADPTGSAEPSQSQALWQEGSGPDSDRRFIHDHLDICATEDTVYFSSGNLIYYADKATGICLPVCGKPECAHNDGNCNAYVPNAGADGLTNYNGRLYWAGQEGSMFSWQWHIYSMAYDGTDRRTVRDLTDWKGTNLQTVFHRGYLYKNWLTQEVVNGIAKQVIYVETYPLEGDGDGLVILRAEEVVYNWLSIQAYGDYVYIAFEAEDGAFELYRWDTRAGALETLYRGDAPIYWEEQFWVTEDGVLFGTRELTDPDAYNEEDWEWPPLMYPEESWEYAIYRFSFETTGFELVSRFHINDIYPTNVTLLDGLVVANWSEPDPHIIRVMIKDFEGETLLDATFGDVEWCIFPSAAMGGYGVDEHYLYFCKMGRQYIAVSRDGSEIRLLWTKDT